MYFNDLVNVIGVEVVKVTKDGYMELYTKEAYNIVKQSLGEHDAKPAYAMSYNNVVTTVDLE